MNTPALVLLAACCLAILLVRRQWAPLPLLVCAVYIPIEQGFEIGPFHFFPIRVALAVAILRLLARGERLEGGLSGVDRAFLWWSAAALLTSLGHDDPSGFLVTRLGFVYTGCGTYFVLRILCRSLDDVDRMCRACVWLLVPVALAMLQEAHTARNLFAELGGVPDNSAMRDGQLRAQGPFLHPILAGSVGAACLPLAAAQWRRRPWTAMTGIAACLAIVFATRSSGPLLGALFGIVGLIMWRYRHATRSIRWMLVLGYLALEVVMNAPAYYALARMDLTGSSTAWHRAALIDAAVTYFWDWWLVGTDYTRHWFAYGVGWSARHADITNYYVRMAVDGGLPLLIAFVILLARAFATVGTTWRRLADGAPAHPHGFLPWALGASLLSHAASFVGVSYFDQSVVFLYVTLVGIASAAATSAAPVEQRPAIAEQPGYIAHLRS